MKVMVTSSQGFLACREEVVSVLKETVLMLIHQRGHMYPIRGDIQNISHYQSGQTLGINNQVSLSRLCQQVLMLVLPVPPHLRAPAVQGGHVESRRP